MAVQEHYENHLGNFYSWMSGDFQNKTKEFQQYLEEHKLLPNRSGVAIDLGAGHGIQSIPLAQLGFHVLALDFNSQLIQELNEHAKGLTIEILREDLRQVKKYKHLNPELILCCGDTLTHLESKVEIEHLIQDIAEILIPGAKVLLSFRDYTIPLIGDQRFIPVKSDESRILTCILDYETDRVRVSDLLYEKKDDEWVQKISSYYKVRISPEDIEYMLRKYGLEIQERSVTNRMIHLIADKP